MKFNLKDRTILLTVAGSRAYGISTPESDIDIKGVAVPTKEYFLGYINKFEQADKSSHLTCFLPLFSDDERDIISRTKLEGSVYNIRKFIKLAADANPNILDALFCREQEVRLQTKAGKLLRENRDLFISKKARWTFNGYAKSQLKRIKTHRKYLLNPMTHKPTRDEFNLPPTSKIPKEQLNAAFSAVKKQIDNWEIDYNELDESTKMYIERQISDLLTEISVASNEKFAAAARLVGYSDNFIHLLKKEREFKVASTQWVQYNDWKKNRNPLRAADEKKYGYDCYTDDTEFLTKNGWKNFDYVEEEDELATVYIGEDLTNRKFGKIEYQKYKDKFQGVFSGDLYNLFGYHIDTLVTPNHRMLIRKVERKSNKKYDWHLCEMANLPDTFEIMMSPVSNNKNYSNKDYFNDINIKPEPFMRLMGWYLSDGTAGFNYNKDNVKTVKVITISQKKGGDLCHSMLRFANKYKNEASCSLYKYINKGDGKFRDFPIEEHRLSVRDKNIINKLYLGCGHGSHNKRIPRWVFSLSKRLKVILIDAMVAGDGTIRKCGFKSIIYYSSSRDLASDIQELSMSCGFETSLYGPYESDNKGYYTLMYQVHINKKAPQIKKMVRARNVKKIPIKNQRIVCFTVPNGTLITRRNGHIGIHGNSKHGGHLFRLLKMAREILVDGKVNIWREDAEEILAVRNGEWSYEKLVDFAESEDKEMQKLYNDSKLPNTPDQKKIDELCIEIVESML